MLNAEFIRKFEFELKAQKEFFKKDCLELIHSTKSNQQKSIFRNLVDHKTFEIDSAISNLEVIFSDESYPVFEFQKTEIINFWSNPIKFKLPTEIIFQSNEKLIREFHQAEFNLENYCSKVFWENKNNIDQYNLVSDFQPFENKIVSKKELSKIYKTCFFFNLKSWSDYLERLLKLSFPDFKFNKTLSTSKVKRYTKDISKNWIFGFEFSTDFKQGLRNHEFHLPYKLNLFLSEINEDSERFSSNSPEFNPLNLGILGNPYFYTPCYMPFEYFCRELYFFPDIVHNTTWKSRHEVQLEKLEYDSYVVNHPVDFGILLKKNAFRFYNLLSLTTSPYLKYIESCLVKSQ